MRNKLITICALAFMPAIAVAQGGGGQGGGGGNGGTGGGAQGTAGQGGATAAGGAAMNVPRTQQQRQRDSVILQQRIMRGDTGQGNQQGYHGTQAAPTATGQSMGVQSDTGQTGTHAQKGQRAQAQQGQDTVTASAGGSVALSGRRNLGLSSDQVKQLQDALNQTGCDAGSSDGVVGPKTRQAIRCAEQQKNISGNDLNQLLQALNLNFTAGNSNGANAASDTTGIDTTGVRSNPATHAVKGDTQQTGGNNAGRVRPVAPPQTKDTSTNAQQGVQRDTSMTNMRDTTGVQGNQMDTTRSNQMDTTRTDTTMSGGDVGTMNRSTRDTTGAMRDTSSTMNRSDTSSMRDTTGMNSRDTTGGQMGDSTLLRDSTLRRDSTRMRDTTSMNMRDTTSTHMRDTTQSH